MTITCALALAMDATLEASERDLSKVRAILLDVSERLVAEFGERARRDAVVALQFQDLSEQLLASAARRIGMVREVLGNDVKAPAIDINPVPQEGEAIEFFQEHP